MKAHSHDTTYLLLTIPTIPMLAPILQFLAFVVYVATLLKLYSDTKQKVEELHSGDWKAFFKSLLTTKKK